MAVPGVLFGKLYFEDNFPELPGNTTSRLVRTDRSRYYHDGFEYWYQVLEKRICPTCTQNILRTGWGLGVKNA